jgi:FKBP-type peptidyl-prolyl cis-trans isomerase
MIHRPTSLVLALSLAATLSLSAQDTPPAPPAPPTEAPAAAAPASPNAPSDPRSYALGVALADSVMDGYKDTNIDLKVLVESFSAKINGQPLAMPQDVIEAEVRKFAEEMDPAARNKKAGEKFLEENKAKDGVKATASGLQYVVLKEGEGDSPTKADTVTAHYTGTLLDGTVFDSSVERGEPAEFELGRVIQGWQEALPLMKKGGKIKVWIPGELAYGEMPPPGSPIAPNSTLVFEIELLKINGK